MFVRWQQRGEKKVFYAYICSGERIERKVKSRTLGYLGSIALNAIALSTSDVDWDCSSGMDGEVELGSVCSKAV